MLSEIISRMEAAHSHNQLEWVAFKGEVLKCVKSKVTELEKKLRDKAMRAEKLRVKNNTLRKANNELKSKVSYWKEKAEKLKC